MPNGPPSRFKALVETVFWQHKRRYGSRRTTAELQEQGYQIGRQQARTLMQLSDLQAIRSRSFVPRTTDSAHGMGYWLNLLLNEPSPRGAA